MDKILHNLYDMTNMHDGELVFLHSNHFPRCTAEVDKHFEGYVSLQLITRGQVELFYDQERWELSGAWLWGCQPGPRIRFHAWPPGGWWEHRYVAVRGPGVARWQARGLWLERPQRMPTGRRFPARFAEMLELLRRGSSWSAERAANLLEGLLLELAEIRQVKERPEDELVVAVRRTLEQTPASARNYAQLARKMGVSLTTLRRRFRAGMGMPLHDYVLQMRIAQARRLLGETNLPIKEIAARLGYADVFYFTRQFRRYMGSPPAAYRRSRQV